MRILSLLLITCQIDVETSCKDKFIFWNLWDSDFFCLSMYWFEKLLQWQSVQRREGIVLFSSYGNWILQPFFPFTLPHDLACFSWLTAFILFRRLPLRSKDYTQLSFVELVSCGQLAKPRSEHGGNRVLRTACLLIMGTSYSALATFSLFKRKLSLDSGPK